MVPVGLVLDFLSAGSNDPPSSLSWLPGNQTVMAAGGNRRAVELLVGTFS